MLILMAAKSRKSRLRSKRIAPKRTVSAHLHRECAALSFFIMSAAFSIAAAGFSIYYFSAMGAATGFLIASGPNYVASVVIGPAGSALSSSSYSLLASIGDALVGEASSTSYVAEFGPIEFFAPPEEEASETIDTGGPTCSLFQSASKIEVGDKVNLTVVCSDISNVTLITLETDEDKKVFKPIIAHYGSPKTISGQNAVATFIWQNADIPDGTRVSWRVRAKDGLGNEATLGTSSFDIGEVTTVSNVSTIAGPPPQELVGKEGEIEENKTEEMEEGTPTLTIQPKGQPQETTAYLYLGIVAAVIGVFAGYYVMKHRRAARLKQPQPSKQPQPTQIGKK